jgi:hypothetical protein
MKTHIISSSIVPIKPFQYKREQLHTLSPITLTSLSLSLSLSLVQLTHINLRIIHTHAYFLVTRETIIQSVIQTVFSNLNLFGICLATEL